MCVCECVCVCECGVGRNVFLIFTVRAECASRKVFFFAVRS